MRKDMLPTQEASLRPEQPLSCGWSPGGKEVGDAAHALWEAASLRPGREATWATGGALDHEPGVLFQPHADLV